MNIQVIQSFNEFLDMREEWDALLKSSASEEGASEYDFLHGNEEYKFHWAREVRSLSRFELHPPQVMAWIYKHAIGLNRAGRQMAKRVRSIAGNNAAFSR